MNTLYLNISSDKVQLSCWTEEILLERNGIEDLLGRDLVKLWRAHGFKRAYVLNGPGGFTNLRVGSLCMNLLNTLVDNQIDFFSVSKVDILKYGYDTWVIAQFGIIYIGQKRNIWLWDFKTNKKIDQFTFDQIEEMIKSWWLQKDSIFLDTVYSHDYYPDFFNSFLQINFSLFKQLMKEYIEHSDLLATKHLEANYMIDPNITPSK